MPRKASPARKAAKPNQEPVKPVTEVPEPVTEARNPCIVRNCVEKTSLSLGDGRRIAFGEEAEVSFDLADFLRSRGQAE